MSKKKNELIPEIEEKPSSTISRAQHGALNNLNMIMFYIRKKNIPQEYLKAIEESSREILTEIKAL